MPKRLLIIGLGAVLLLLAACGGDSGSSGTISYEPFDLEAPRAPLRREAELKPGANGLVGAEIKPIIPDQPPPEFLVEQDLIEGIGQLVQEGSTVTLQYVGFGYASKQKFASSWDEGKPFTFTLGKGEVSRGWEEGIPEMEVSDQRELVIPPDLTAGGPPRDAPQGEALVYLIDLLSLE